MNKKKYRLKNLILNAILSLCANRFDKIANTRPTDPI